VLIHLSLQSSIVVTPDGHNPLLLPGDLPLTGVDMHPLASAGASAGPDADAIIGAAPGKSPLVTIKGFVVVLVKVVNVPVPVVCVVVFVSVPVVVLPVCVVVVLVLRVVVLPVCVVVVVVVLVTVLPV